MPTLSDQRIVHVNPFGREVFAKLTMGKLSADLLFPPACVFDGVGVERFVRPPVGLAIRLVISGKIDPSGCDPTDGGCLPDTTPGRATAVFKLVHAADVDGKNLSYGS